MVSETTSMDLVNPPTIALHMKASIDICSNGIEPEDMRHVLEEPATAGQNCSEVDSQAFGDNLSMPSTFKDEHLSHSGGEEDIPHLEPELLPARKPLGDSYSDRSDEPEKDMNLELLEIGFNSDSTTTSGSAPRRANDRQASASTLAGTSQQTNRATTKRTSAAGAPPPPPEKVCDLILDMDAAAAAVSAALTGIPGGSTAPTRKSGPVDSVPLLGARHGGTVPPPPPPPRRSLSHHAVPSSLFGTDPRTALYQFPMPHLSSSMQPPPPPPPPPPPRQLLRTFSPPHYLQSPAAMPTAVNAMNARVTARVANVVGAGAQAARLGGTLTPAQAALGLASAGGGVLIGEPPEMYGSLPPELPPRFRVSISGPTADLAAEYAASQRPMVRWHASSSGLSSDLPSYTYGHPPYAYPGALTSSPFVANSTLASALQQQQYAVNGQNHPRLSSNLQQQQQQLQSQLQRQVRPGPQPPPPPLQQLPGRSNTGRVLAMAQLSHNTEGPSLLNNPTALANAHMSHGPVGCSAAAAALPFLTPPPSLMFAHAHSALLGQAEFQLHHAQTQIQQQQQQQQQQSGHASLLGVQENLMLDVGAVTGTAHHSHPRGLMANAENANSQQQYFLETHALQQQQQLQERSQQQLGDMMAAALVARQQQQQRHEQLGVKLNECPVSPLSDVPALVESAGNGPHGSQRASSAPSGVSLQDTSDSGSHAGDSPIALVRLYEASFAAAVADALRSRDSGGLKQLQHERDLLYTTACVLAAVAAGRGMATFSRQAANGSRDAEMTCPDVDAELGSLLAAAQRHVGEWPTLSEPFRYGILAVARALSLGLFSAVGAGHLCMERWNNAVQQLLFTLAAVEEPFQAALHAATSRPPASQEQQQPSLGSGPGSPLPTRDGWPSGASPEVALCLVAALCAATDVSGATPAPSRDWPEDSATRSSDGGAAIATMDPNSPLGERHGKEDAGHSKGSTTAAAATSSAGNAATSGGGAAQLDDSPDRAVPPSEAPRAGRLPERYLSRSSSTPAHRSAAEGPPLLTNLFSSFNRSTHKDLGVNSGLGPHGVGLDSAALVQLFDDDPDLLGAAAAAAAMGRWRACGGDGGGRGVDSSASASSSSVLASFLESFSAASRSSMAFSPLIDPSTSSSYDLSSLSLSRHTSPRTSPANPLALRGELAAMQGCSEVVGPAGVGGAAGGPAATPQLVGQQASPTAMGPSSSVGGALLQPSEFGKGMEPRITPGSAVGGLVGPRAGYLGMVGVGPVRHPDMMPFNQQHGQSYLQCPPPAQHHHQQQQQFCSNPTLMCGMADPAADALLGALDSSGDLDPLSWDPETLQAALRILHATSQLDG